MHARAPVSKKNPANPVHNQSKLKLTYVQAALSVCSGSIILHCDPTQTPTPQLDRACLEISTMIVSNIQYVQLS